MIILSRLLSNEESRGRTRAVPPWLVDIVLTIYVAWLGHWRLLGYGF